MSDKFTVTLSSSEAASTTDMSVTGSSEVGLRWVDKSFTTTSFSSLNDALAHTSTSTFTGGEASPEAVGRPPALVSSHSSQGWAATRS